MKWAKQLFLLNRMAVKMKGPNDIKHEMGIPAHSKCVTNMNYGFLIRDLKQIGPWERLISCGEGRKGGGVTVSQAFPAESRG